jgi:GGDEF domain-containing protein
MSLSMDDIFDVYQVQPQDHGPIDYHLVGRYMLHENDLQVLADFRGFLGHLAEGPLTDQSKRGLEALKRSPYFRVVSREEMKNGLHPDLIKDQQYADAEDPHVSIGRELRPPSMFEYMHPIIGNPVDIEIRGGVAHFNGQPLSRLETHRILEHVRSGVATIRYKKNAAAAILKMEQTFKDLVKIEPHLEQSLMAIRAAVKAGHIHPDVERALSREIFVDPMVPNVGNKKAYADFMSRPQQGVHVQLDGNSFGSINKLHSFEHGNQAIIAMGNALRDARDEAVGPKNGKLFRIGGDEFVAHFPTHEHAARFMRAARAKLEAIPPVGGTHQLSVSAGFGRNAAEADQAQIHAKNAKKAANYPLGREKTHVHSLIPGNEGPVPIDPPQGATRPPEPSVPTPAAPEPGLPSVPKLEHAKL